MTESTAENVRNLPQSSSAISDEQIEDTEEEVDDLNRPKNVVPSAINFEGFSFAKLMSIEEYKDLGEKLIQYQIDKMEKEKTLPKETKDSDQKCSIAGCNFRRIRGHITCQVHQSVAKIVMRRTNGLKCSVDHCNRRTEISSKDKLCCLCSTIDEIYRVPPIPINKNSNLINKTEMRQIACNDIQMRLRPWLFYLLVTENPDFDISDLVLYGGFTRRQIVERLEDHKKIKTYTWIYKLFGRRSCFNLEAGGKNNPQMNEEKSGTFPTYIFVYLDKRTVKNAHVNYLDRSDSSKVDLLHPTTNIPDSILEQFPTFPLFYNADVRMNTWLRILNFELPFTHGEQVRTGLRKYVCKFPVHQNEFCNSSYDKLKGLYQSPKSFHEFKADKTKCNPQTENFKTAAELKEHWQRVHNVLPFKCECCGERFENNQQRSKHKEQEAEGNCRFYGVSIECNLFLSHLESDHRDEKIDTLDETDYEDEE